MGADEELIGGLSNALARGSNLEQAKQSFVSAGYKIEDIEAAAQKVPNISSSVARPLNENSEVSKKNSKGSKNKMRKEKNSTGRKKSFFKRKNKGVAYGMKNESVVGDSSNNVGAAVSDNSELVAPKPQLPQTEIVGKPKKEQASKKMTIALIILSVFVVIGGILVFIFRDSLF